MVLGYNPKEEIKEIGTELKSSRNSILVAIISFVGGTLAAGQIKKYINKDEEEEDYE